MKQVSNSLLTLFSTPFNAISARPAFPRDKAGACRRLFTPFCVHRETLRHIQFLPDMSCPPRSIVHFRLGEGRIRSLLHGIGFFLIAACFAALSIGTAKGAEGIVLHLKEKTAVSSNRVFLKDIADIKGPDRERLDALSRIPLGPAPEFGTVSTWNRHHIEESLQSYGLLKEFRFAGALAVQVRLRGRPLCYEDIEPLVRSHLLKTTSWKESEIRVGAIGNFNGIELPPGKATLRISSNSAIKGSGKVVVPVEIVQEDRTLRCFWITATVEIHAEVATASRRIPRGTILGADDIVLKSTEIKDMRASYVRRSADAVGTIAQRTFHPGDPLSRKALAKPFLVKKGETVRLRLQRNGIVLTSLVRAEQNGRLGQIIRVRNLDFSTVLSAQVTGKAEVELQ
jgi:flagella basal body P-ring formation protein FlgA